MGSDSAPKTSGESMQTTNSTVQTVETIEPIAPTASNENHPQADPQPTKSPKATIWCLAILATIAVITAIVFAVLYFTKPTNTASTSQDNTPAPTQPTEPTEPAQDEEIIISDTYVLRELDGKMAIIHDTTETGPFFIKQGVGLGYYNVYPLYSGEGLSDIAKLVHVAKSTTSDYPISEDAMQAIISERGFDEPNAEAFRKTYKMGIKGETLETKYYDVFGETLDKGAANGQPYCPSAFYNSTYDFYYLTSECGGTGPYTGLYYKNKYTANDKQAYVYVSTGTFNADNHKIYCDIIDSSLGEASFPSVCEESVNPQGYDMGDYKIDQTNYQNFAQYRFVFNKAEDGTYYFSTVEKL